MGVYLWNNVYEYSYDFRNKSVAICQADGRSFGTTSGVTINSDGLTSSPLTYVYRPIPSLTNAKKITMSLFIYNNGASSSSGNSNTQCVLTTSNPTQNYTGYYGDYYILGLRAYGTDLVRQTFSISAGTYTPTVTIDFVNKTMKFVYGSIINTTQNITDTQISNIKSSSLLRVVGEKLGYAKTVSLTIEE